MIFFTAQIHRYQEYWDSWNSLGLGWLAILFMILGGIIIIGSSLYISHIMHKDAIRKSIPYPELWLFVGLILNVFGLIIYRINRGNYQQKR